MQRIIKSNFIILLLISIFSCNKVNINTGESVIKPYYSTQYISANTGKANFEIPEVLELLQIAQGLTSYANKNRNTTYWKEAETYFKSYKNHPLITKLEGRIKDVFADYDLRMGAFAMEFDAQGKLVEGFYPYIAGFGEKNAINPFLQFQSEFQDFAEKSNFRAFYQSKRAVYEEMKALQSQLMPVRKMWTWLEDRFPARSHSYKIIFSPIFGSNHNTTWFGDEKIFRESIMWVSYLANSNSAAPTQEVRIALASRVVFTEIDHNYVNPVSDTYLKEINEIFGNRAKWAAAGNANADAYNNAYSLFNEYMTWAVFTLYAYDNFAKSDFDIVNQATINLMMTTRGFPMYKQFNEQLLAFYKENPRMKSKDFFDKMLAWARTQ